MTTYNTGNNLGSTDPRDLSDNSENFDRFANGQDPSYDDRLGNSRKSIAGMEKDFDDFLASSGYELLGDYESGIEVTAYNQIIRESGEFWRAAADTSLPYTTGGSGMPEDGAFVSVGDANLRQELADEEGYKLVGNTVWPVDSVATLRASSFPANLKRLWLSGYYGIGTAGGGPLYYDPDDTTTSDNGGTVLVDNDGRRWKRPNPENGVTVMEFGAIADGSTDDWEPINNCVNSGLPKIYLPPGEYYCSKTFNLKNRIVFEGPVGFGATNSPSILSFENGTNGMIVHRGDTNADDLGKNNTTEASTTSAEGSIIRNMRVQRKDGTEPASYDEITHGIRLRGRALLENMRISGFQGNGIHIVATSGGDPDLEGNANNWSLSDVRSENNWKGFYAEGADVNAGTSYGLDCTGNGSYGVHESSFLGNTHIGVHAARNGDKAILSDGNNDNSTWINPYIEPGGTAIFEAPRGNYLIGGILNDTEKIGDFFSLNSLPPFTSEEGQFLDGITGTARIVDIWNTGGISSDRRSAMTFTSGSPGSEMKLGSVFGRPSESNTSHRGAVGFEIYDGSTDSWEIALQVFGKTNTVLPGNDDQWALGSSGSRFTEVFASTGTINTSDRNEKQQIQPIDDALLDAWGDVEWVQYKWNHSVKDKGDDARIHTGLIAQQVKEALENHGLDPFRYGLLCWDEWENEDGTTGSRYGVRYSECQAVEAAWVRRKMANL